MKKTKTQKSVEKEVLRLKKKRGDFFKHIRTNAKKTQKEIADDLELSSAQYISNIERGVSPPSSKVLKAMSKVYNFNLSELVQSYINYEHFIMRAECSLNE